MERERSEAAIAALRAASLAIVLAAVFALYVVMNPPGSHKRAEPSAYRFKIDLRTASAEELQLIPNFGPKLSEAWVQQRPALLSRYGDPLEAIANVRGIGPAKIAELRKHVIDGRSETSTAAD